MAAVSKKLRSAMNMWRRGVAALPDEYIALHRKSAEENIQEFMETTGCRFITSEMISDGWMDGMKVLRVIAENDTGIREFRWSDSNGGSWFERTPSGGQALIYSPINRPGFI